MCSPVQDKFAAHDKMGKIIVFKGLVAVNNQAYDSFGDEYDKFVNWEIRLRYEMPFIEAQLGQLVNKPQVLDAACGTGMHAIALARMGFHVAGADLSNGMVAQSRKNADAANLDVRFEQAGFGMLAATFGEEAFDAVLCLGNSLPHVLSEQELQRTLVDFAHCLRPGKMVIIQNRNFDAALQSKERWMEPQAYRAGENEWLFLRFYDYLADGMIDFNIITLRRGGDGIWQQSVICTSLRPLLHDELFNLLLLTGFENVKAFGDMSGAPFDRTSSGNLVMTATRKRSLI